MGSGTRCSRYIPCLMNHICLCQIDLKMTNLKDIEQNLCGVKTGVCNINGKSKDRTPEA